MELHCPNCTKKLAIPDQFAGQLMKCPLCNGTFTTPKLPVAPAATAPQLPAAPPPTPPSPAPAAPLAASAPPPQVPPPASPPFAVERSPICLHELTIPFEPRIVQWVAAGALLLAFCLTFTTWTSIAPRGVGVLGQNAWQAAFATYTADAEAVKEHPLKDFFGEPAQPTVDGWLICYLLLLVLALLAVLAACILPRSPWAARLAKLLPWRWTLALLVSAFAFLCLLLVSFSGIGMENRVQEAAMQKYAKEIRDAKEPGTRRMVQMLQTQELSVQQRSSMVGYVVWLHLLALLCVALVLWLELSPTQAVPHFDLRW